MAGLRQVLYAADDDGKAFRVSAGTAAAYTSLNQNLLDRPTRNPGAFMWCWTNP